MHICKNDTHVKTLNLFILFVYLISVQEYLTYTTAGQHCDERCRLCPSKTHNRPQVAG